MKMQKIREIQFGTDVWLLVSLVTSAVRPSKLHVLPFAVVLLVTLLKSTLDLKASNFVWTDQPSQSQIVSRQFVINTCKELSDCLFLLVDNDSD